MTKTPGPSIDDVRDAAARIAPFVHRTPVVTSASLDSYVGAEVFAKAENLQRAGAFKYRGATNAVQSLAEDEARAGVATHSSGNHGAALARAAQVRGIDAWIVVPEDAPPPKLAAIHAYGANIVTCEPTLPAREATLRDVVARTGAHVVHPYDDDRVIAGAATATLELLDEVGPLDAIVVPVGGGGLASGTCIAAHAIDTRIRVIGAEPAGAADAAESLASGHVVPQVHPDTIADGLRTSLSERTFAILRSHLERITTVDDDDIVAAMRFVWERTKLMVEPSGAVAVAAARQAALDGARVGVILSGGNVDLDALPWS